MTNIVNAVKTNNKEEKYVEWLFKDHASDYNHVRIFGKHVLVTLFYYWTQESSLILDQKTKADTYIKFYPIGKVLAVGNESERGLQVGDIVFVGDRWKGQASNPDFEKYEAYLKDSAKDEAKVSSVKPVIAAIDNYRNQYGFKQDKLSDELTEQDLFTFLLPDPLLLCGQIRDLPGNVSTT